MLGHIPKDPAERARQAEEVVNNFSAAQAAKSVGNLSIVIALLILAFNADSLGWVSLTFTFAFAACAAYLWRFSARRLLIEQANRDADTADLQPNSE